MTNEQMRIAIAKEIGLHSILATTARDANDQLVAVPNYPEDLNACYEMEKALTHGECVLYNQRLNDSQAEDAQERNGDNQYPAQDFWFHATARQRCEAFLKVKGLWKEEA